MRDGRLTSGEPAKDISPALVVNPYKEAEGKRTEPPDRAVGQEMSSLTHVKNNV